MATRALNFDFYELSVPDEPRSLLKDALKKSPSTYYHLNKPTGQIWNFGDFERDGAFIYGTLVFNQMMELPPSFDNRTRKLGQLRLSDDQGLAHATSFLLDTDLNILMFESKKGGVSLNALCEFLERNYSLPPLSTSIVMDPQKMIAFQKMTEIHRFQVAIAKVENGGIFSDNRSSFHQITHAADGTNNSTLEYVISTRRKAGLQTPLIKRFVHDFLRYKPTDKTEGRGELRKMVVTGREDGDGTSTQIDFIKNRLRTSIEMETSRWSSDFTVREKMKRLRDAYLEKRPLLKKVHEKS